MFSKGQIQKNMWKIRCRTSATILVLLSLKEVTEMKNNEISARCKAFSSYTLNAPAC